MKSSVSFQKQFSGYYNPQSRSRVFTRTINLLESGSSENCSHNVLWKQVMQFVKALSTTEINPFAAIGVSFHELLTEECLNSFMSNDGKS